MSQQYWTCYKSFKHHPRGLSGKGSMMPLCISKEQKVYIYNRRTPQIQLSLYNHFFFETTVRKERLMAWKSSEEKGTHSPLPWPPSHTSFQPPSLLNSWEVCDTLLELIRVEWGKRWGETAEITSLLSLPVLSALSPPATVPVFPDRRCVFCGGGGGGGGGSCSGGAVAERLLSSKSRGWWNNSLIQWSDNEKKWRLEQRVIKAQYLFFFF